MRSSTFSSSLEAISVSDLSWLSPSVKNTINNYFILSSSIVSRSNLRGLEKWVPPESPTSVLRWSWNDESSIKVNLKALVPNFIKVIFLPFSRKNFSPNLEQCFFTSLMYLPPIDPLSSIIRQRCFFFCCYSLLSVKSLELCRSLMCKVTWFPSVNSYSRVPKSWLLWV